MADGEHGEPTDEIQQPTFNPLAPLDPSVTREADQWFLDQDLEEMRRILAAEREAPWPPSRHRTLGGAAYLRRRALDGEIKYLRDRLNQSEPSEDRKVDDKEDK